MSTLSIEELECWQLNFEATNLLWRSLCRDVQGLVYRLWSLDAHINWELIKDLYNELDSDDEEESKEESLEECSTSSTFISEPQVISLNEEEGQKHQVLVSLDEVNLCLMSKKKRIKSKKGEIQKIEESSSSAKEFDLLKANYASLVSSKSSIEHVFVETCDDLITEENQETMKEVNVLKGSLIELDGNSKVQPSQDNHDNMVNKLEERSTTPCSPPQQHLKISKNKVEENNKLEHIKCSHCSTLGHYAFSCPTKLKGENTLSKKKRSLSKKRVCYGCKEKEHLIAMCPNVTSVDATGHRRQMGHMSKDCPNGNTIKSNLIQYDFNRLGRDKVGACATREIDSPQTSIRTIWIPKHLVTNLYGPNKVWVPKKSC
ncbi:hypothetical protein HU200_021386 [Digitaria exilis]|uniref:CCHC-type domain-containing protein n=1 Tax=Digitaria exilis TaxID=1010633 RepID=A0A835F0B8_9POAL|nr:hypothetical protein HU200_021386 [Digitaria exilis]